MQSTTTITTTTTAVLRLTATYHTKLENITQTRLTAHLRLGIEHLLSGQGRC